MDRLTVMRSFVSVSKSASFSQAARSLGISGSLVSRHVAELERSFGVRLVNRTARTISLTDTGSRYAEFAARVIEEIDREEAQLRGLRDKAEGSLAIISPTWIDVGDAIVADLEFALCAAPGYLHRAGQPNDVGGLNEHDCLVNTDDPTWHLSHAGHELRIKINDPVCSSNSYLTLRKAVLAGRGIALLPTRLVAGELNDGSLVHVIDGCEVPDRPLYAVHSPDGQPSARVQLFLDFATEWFRRLRNDLR